MNADELRRSEDARLERLLERVTPIENTRLQYVELNQKCAEAQQYLHRLSLLKKFSSDCNTIPNVYVNLENDYRTDF